MDRKNNWLLLVWVGKIGQMNCNCGKEVGKHAILRLCDDCYKKHKRHLGKKYRDKTTSAIPQNQSRGVHSSGWAVCCRTDCDRKFRAQPWQNPRWSLCPRHKELLSGRSAAINWIQREPIRGRRVA